MQVNITIRNKNYTHMRTKLNIYITTLFFAAIIYGCGNGNRDEAKEIYKPVKYDKVRFSGGIVERTFNGVSKSSSETNLSFRSNGLITSLNIKVGQRVKKGQLLGQLDQKDAIISLEKAKVDKRNAEVQLETSRSNFERVKQLYQTNNASLSDYEKSKSGYSNAQSQYEAAQRAVELQGSQIEYTKLYAPMDGVISAKNSNVNEFAQAGSPIIVMSSGRSDAEVDVGIPEGYINKISHGDEVLVTFVALGNIEVKGIVTEVGYSSGGATTFPVIIKIVGQVKDIRPGMAAKVRFSFGNKDTRSRLVVPVKAVGNDQDGNFVYTLVAEGNHYIAKKQVIEIGALASDGFIVISGVDDGDIVAVAGLRSLYDGMKVSLLNR